MADLTESTATSLAASRMLARTYVIAFACKRLKGDGLWVIRALLPTTMGWTEVVDDS